MQGEHDNRSHHFLTIAEAADEARVSTKRIRNLMSLGVLREGIHYTRPRGLRPRFRRDALLAWLNGDGLAHPPAQRRRGHGRAKLNPVLLSGTPRNPAR